MNEYSYISNNESDTKELAKKIASKLTKNDIILLSGDLGSGKTKFVEGFLSHYNLQNEISSPTFNIINDYSNNLITIYHFDVYRLQNSLEFFEIGGEEFFNNGICLIEWGEIILDAIPPEYIHIIFKRNDNNENSRIINILTYGEKYNKIFDKILIN